MGLALSEIVCSPGVTPVNLLIASMVAGHFPHVHISARWMQGFTWLTIAINPVWPIELYLIGPSHSLLKEHSDHGSVLTY